MVAIGMSNYQQPLGSGHSDSDLTIFFIRMVRVIDGDAQGISKNSGCLSEGDTMLEEVAFCLLGVPLES
jgi:hypothetical protein